MREEHDGIPVKITVIEWGLIVAFAIGAILYFFGDAA